MISDRLDDVQLRVQVPNTAQQRAPCGVLAELTHLLYERGTTGYADRQETRLETQMRRADGDSAMLPSTIVLVEGHLDPVTDQSLINKLP